MIKKLFRVSRFLHKWAGLFLAVQILLWILGGVVMSVIPLEKVHGDHLAIKNLNYEIDNSQYAFSLDTLRLKVSEPIHSISLTEFLGEPYYAFQTTSGAQLFHAITGDIKGRINADEAALIANQHYLGDGNLVERKLLDKAPMEASRNKGQVWQLRFDDTWNTTLYVSPTSGKLTTIRSDLWRIFDFFWMLHIMDYDEREDFNNPLLITFSISALMFTLTGIILLFKSFNITGNKKHKRTNK
ncbi:hypothetical protein Q4574_21335 [Aliiglaciecola sp. 3_MG-2023]|uniref:hypothetical protein n=1 Tax=Aliiglaciecola sp. 3_MG-2023 TaxID=3062644 RepID=UPI0026E2A960|nr:hypothetical protein [Aliiglaciecola sp. 3_MG-2023]MDO6695854.1 hypothetical protein [Aliiglaciecola sp. 3_MG-2023]